MINLAINGLGRIGRQILKIILKDKQFNIIFLNDPLMTTKTLCYLLKHDSLYNSINFNLSVGAKEIKIDKHIIKVYNLDKLSYRQLNKIDLLIDTSKNIDVSKFLKSNKNLKIIVTYDYKNSERVVMGFNETQFNIKKRLFSGLTCDTTAILPILKEFLKSEINFVNVISIHPALSNQQILDNFPSSKKNFDLATIRSYIDTVVPRNTSIDKIIIEMIPSLKNKVNSYQMRVPTSTVTCAFITLFTNNIIDKTKLIQELKRNKLLEFNKDQLVSKDFSGSKRSAIIDLRYFKINNNSASFLIWYDNEVGYSNRIVEFVKKIITKANRDDYE